MFVKPHVNLIKVTVLPGMTDLTETHSKRQSTIRILLEVEENCGALIINRVRPISSGPQ